MYRYDMYREVEDHVFAIGRLNMDLPALTRTVNGTITSPILWVDENGAIANVFKTGPLFKLNEKGEECIFHQTKKEDMKNPRRKTLSIAVNRGEKTLWLPLEVWEKTAIYIHKSCHQGDLVAIVAKKKKADAKDTGAEVTTYNVENFQLLVPKRSK